MNFPELHRESTMELPAVGILSFIIGAVLLPKARVLGAIVLIPGALWLLGSARISIVNARLRYRWSRQFLRRINWQQLKGLVEAEPKRYAVHVRYYGGFDAVRLTPAAVLEDRVTGELAAIYPASWRVLRVCQQHGVELIDSQRRPE